MERRRPRHSSSGKRSFAHHTERKASQRPWRRNNSGLCGTRHGSLGRWLYYTMPAASDLSVTYVIRSTMCAFSRSVQMISGHCALQTGYFFTAGFRSLNSAQTVCCWNLYSTSTHLRTASILLTHNMKCCRDLSRPSTIITSSDNC